MISTQNLAANTRFTYTWTNTNNWNRLKRGTSYCVKVTATDSGNANASRAVNLNSAIGSLASDIDQYAPSIRATARFNAQAGLPDVHGPLRKRQLHRHAHSAREHRMERHLAHGELRRRQHPPQHVVLRQGDQRVRKPNFSIGTVSAEPRDYPASLTYILGRLRAVDGDGEDFEDDLDDAITHVTVAKAYWDARTQDGAFEDFNDVAMNWGPSFRRAVRAIKSMSSARRNGAPCAQDLRDRPRRRHFAAGQGLRQHHARRAYERRHP